MSIEKMKLMVLAVALTVGLAACDKPNSAEDAGKKIDQAAASATDKIDLATEKAGDKLDEASKKLSEETDKTREVLEDATITAKIKTDMAAKTGIKSMYIKVDTIDGVVTLTGEVSSQENSDKAKEIAGGVAKVKRVENNLVIKAPN